MLSWRSLSEFLLAVLLCVAPVAAQNFEVGGHVGLAVLGNEGRTLSPNRETGGEFGLWVAIWPSSRLAIAGDWSYVPRDDFFLDLEPSPVGEERRNRQFVDFTLQYHFPDVPWLAPFVEAGGGAHWNNRHIVNPGGIPAYGDPGKESTRYGMWTIGGGFRKRIAPHLNWITEMKVHNPGRDGRDSFRVFTGLTVSIR